MAKKKTPPPKKSFLEKAGDSLWKGTKEALKFGAKVGADFTADSAEALQVGVKNSQTNAKTKIEANPNIDNTTKAAAKVGIDIVGGITRIGLGIFKHGGRVIKKNL